MRNMSLTALAVVAGVSLATAAKAEPQVEVLHWWTSGGEARAIQVLVDDFKAAGGTWTDMPVAGGGGDAARTALKARVLSGNPPTAFQMKGPSIQEWYEEGALSTGIDAMAKEQNWDGVLPASIANHMTCEGKYCAAPVNVHRIDWIWANPAVLAKAAPYLVRLRPGDLFSHWLISRGWGESWVIFIASLCSLDELLVHCRRFLMVKDESGKPFYFRYYDPRVLRTYLPSCNKQELTFLFDKVDSYYAESEDGREIYQYSLDQGALAKKTNPLLSQPQ